MYTNRVLLILLALGLVVATLVTGVATAQEPAGIEPDAVLAIMGTTFTYQGRLVDDGNPASGTYDFQFSLFDASVAGSQIGSTVAGDDVAVNEGLFTADLDFGASVFDGQARWLEIEVKRDADGSYTTLSPRVALTPSPHALALPGLWTQQNATSPNLIGGYPGNVMGAGVTGGVIAGGGWNVRPNRVYDIYGAIGGGANNEAGLNGSGGRGYATIAGGWDNTASDYGASVAGGRSNTASGYVSSVSGGWNGHASGYASTVGGGYYNLSAAAYATIAGGGPWNTGSPSTTNNIVYDDYGTIGGGGGNVVGINDGDATNQEFSTVAGGRNNTVSGELASIGGGANNEASGWLATVSGGNLNEAGGSQATIAGGWNNEADGSQAAVGGGRNNLAAASYATIGGGGPSDGGNSSTTNNRVYDDYGTIGGGGGNVVGLDDGDSTNQDFSTVAGGRNNAATDKHASVGGGDSNVASGYRSTISGGHINKASDGYTTVGGGSDNTAGGYVSTVGGGYHNNASGYSGAVGGGYDNAAGGDYATIGGGKTNFATGDYATVGGGLGNSATTRAATVAGGWGNEATAYHTSIGGGLDNAASGAYSTVSGGTLNIASNGSATVPGGVLNTAAGAASFAAGRRAKANHDGAFVWADSTDADYSSTAADTFNVRAANGVMVAANSNSNGLQVINSGADAVSIYAQNTGSGKDDATLRADNTATSGGVTAYLTNNSNYATVHAYNSSNGEVLYLQNGGDSAGGGGGDFIKAVNEAASDTQFRVTTTGEVRSDIGFNTPAADFAEMLPAVDGLEPGDVLAIAPDGRLLRTTEAYQSTVLGVYSTRPGFVGGMSMEGEVVGKIPLAVVGVVPVKASAEGGAIQPGDLLAASSTPGHAMKAVPDAPQGTIIGKALESLAGEIGVIQMLVMLQ
ncbi:MAG: hypothetical protein GY764_15810 [Halieaceae bacterium]|nr:hypothetical protein [Halieaceae bacterium]